MTPPDVVNVAVVGLGVGEQHARAYAAHPHCALRWLYDLDQTRSQRLGAPLGATLIADRYEQIIEDPDTQLVSIASFDDAHFEQTLSALGAGKHVFVEKPLCRTVEELQVLKQAWSANGRPALASNLVLRAAPLYRWLKEAIAGGEFGEVYAIDGEYLYGRLEKVTVGWRKDVDDYSVMLGGGVHLVDLMLWLTGALPERVSAVGNAICARGTDFRYHDYTAATYRFAGGSDGLIGRITANFGCIHRHHHILRVFGTKATFLYDGSVPRLHHSPDAGATATALPYSPLPVTKGDLIPDVIAAIREGRGIERMTQHDFNVMSACLAADEAVSDAQERAIEYV